MCVACVFVLVFVFVLHLCLYFPKCELSFVQVQRLHPTIESEYRSFLELSVLYEITKKLKLFVRSRPRPILPNTSI